MSTIMSPSPTLSELDIELPSLRCCHCGRSPAPGRERSTKRCQTCFLVNYCSPKCQRAHNDLHMSVCRPADDYSHSAVWGVRFQDAKFESHRDLKTKPCMSTPQTRGWVCPATELIGLPIYIAPAGTVQYAASKDLQSVCHYLMMDPDTGFAMDSWTSDTRHKENNYCAFHNGKHPLTARTFETVVAFLKMIVEHVSGLDPMRGWAPMRAFLTPQAFQLFSRVYWKEQVNDGREGWEELAESLL